MKLFNGGVEENVLSVLLSFSGVSTDELIKHVERRRGSVTKQGVYRVLRKLKREGKVVIYKSSVSVNALWIEKLRSLTQGSVGKSIFGDLSVLREGEKLVIDGKTLIETDALWSEAFINIENKIGPKHPLYLYNVHNWTILVQPEIDKIHVDRLHHKQRPVFLSIGGRTQLDKETVRLAIQDKIHCSLSSLLKNRNSFAVIGDYVLSIKLSRSSETLVDKVFREYVSSDEGGRGIKAINGKVKAKIFIEKNHAKAKDLKKKIARDFFIPKQNKDF